MNKYLVRVTETLWRQVVLDADTKKDAEEKADRLYQQEIITLDPKYLVDTRFDAIQIPDQFLVSGGR